MPENPKKLFADVLEAVRRIQTHCDGKTRDDYLNASCSLSAKLWRDCGRVIPRWRRKSRTSIASSASATGSFMDMMRSMIFSSGTPSRTTCPRWSPKWKNCWARKLELPEPATEES